MTNVHPQVIHAFICSLLEEGVDPKVVEEAIARTRSKARPGTDIASGNPLNRAFASEQARLLERTW